MGKSVTPKTMPHWMQGVLRQHIQGITLPPFGIYLRAGYEENAVLRAHEAVHWAQYERMGAVKFYANYLWQALKHGYRENPMEIEAREKSEGGTPR
jgi:hypothetical protein